MTRTCTLCGAPVDVELAQARAVVETIALAAGRAFVGERPGGPVRLVAHARCTDPLCGLLELIDLEAASS